MKAVPFSNCPNLYWSSILQRGASDSVNVFWMLYIVIALLIREAGYLVGFITRRSLVQVQDQ